MKNYKIFALALILISSIPNNACMFHISSGAGEYGNQMTSNLQIIERASVRPQNTPRPSPIENTTNNTNTLIRQSQLQSQRGSIAASTQNTAMALANAETPIQQTEQIMNLINTNATDRANQATLKPESLIGNIISTNCNINLNSKNIGCALVITAITSAVVIYFWKKYNTPAKKLDRLKASLSKEKNKAKRVKISAEIKNIQTQMNSIKTKN